MARWSLHPGGRRRPEPVPEPEAPLSPEQEAITETSVFNPEAAATDGNPFPEELAEEVVEEATDYNSMTVAALRDILSERGLTVRGTKAELVARLEADDSGPSEEAPDEPAETPSEEAVSSDEMPEEGDVSESGEQEDS